MHRFLMKVYIEGFLMSTAYPIMCVFFLSFFSYIFSSIVFNSVHILYWTTNMDPIPLFISFTGICHTLWWLCSVPNMPLSQTFLFSSSWHLWMITLGMSNCYVCMLCGAENVAAHYGQWPGHCSIKFATVIFKRRPRKFYNVW